jgi:peptidoglycan/LPS O-acetylase OafA/YrhL
MREREYAHPINSPFGARPRHTRRPGREGVDINATALSRRCYTPRWRRGAWSVCIDRYDSSSQHRAVSRHESSRLRMEYRREIDGLRALAVVPVILFHAGYPTFSGGFVGVDIFFVISGYLITSIIIGELTRGTFSQVLFYERRARRILPALFFVMGVCLPFAWLWMPPEDLRKFAQSIVAVCVFSSNLLFWKTSGYFETTTELKPLLHTWSLAVEEQYYVFFPIILGLLWRFGKRRVLTLLTITALASLLLAQWQVEHDPSAAFYLLPARAWELLIGAFAAFHLADPARKRGSLNAQQLASGIGLSLVLIANFAFDQQTPFPGTRALVPTLGAVLIVLYATPRTFVGRLLGSKILVGIGLISYSAYLWHQPLLAFAKLRAFGEPNQSLLGLACIVSFFLAYCTWRYVEAPFRDKQRLTRRQIFAGGAAASVAFVAVGLSGTLSRGFPSRLSPEARQVLAGSVDVSRVPAQSQRDVVLGDGSSVKAVLIGDSHAETLARPLGDHMHAHKLGGLLIATTAGCAPARGLYRLDTTSYASSCEEYERNSARIVSNAEIETVIIAARFTLYLESSRFDNGEGGVEKSPPVKFDGVEFLHRSRTDAERKTYLAQRFTEDIQQWLAVGKKVVLVYPIPEVGWDAPRQALKKDLILDEAPEVSTAYARFLERNRFTHSVLDSIPDHPRLRRVRPQEVLCNTFIADRCAAVTNTLALYFDNNHLTNAGAKLVVGQIAEQFDD